MSKGSNKQYLPLTILADGERLEIGNIVYDEKRERLQARFDLPIGPGTDLSVLSFALREKLIGNFALVGVPVKLDTWIIHLPSLEKHEDDSKQYNMCDEEPWEMPEEGRRYDYVPCSLCESLAAAYANEKKES